MFSSTTSEFNLRLADLLRRERGGTAEFLVALVDFDRQHLYEALGYTSLFMYLHRELGLSKAVAYSRNTAAAVLRDYPEILEPLRDGRLCSTAVGVLARVITLQNRAEVIPRFFHCSKREALEVAAALSPVAAPPTRDVVTRLSLVGVVRPGEPHSSVRTTAAVAASPLDTPGLAPAPGETARGAPGAATPPLDAHHDPSLAATVDPERVLAFAFNRTPAAVVPDTPGPPREAVEPLTATLFRLHLTLSRGFVEKLDAARDALSHSKPGATRAEVLEAGLDLLLAQHDRRKGLVKRPRAAPPPSASDAIPAHVRRAVWTRDGGCCQWKLTSGEICGSRTRVQFDHVIPRARGGPSSVENVRLLCGPHNRLAARRILGDACVDRHAPRRKGGERAGGG